MNTRYKVKIIYLLAVLFISTSTAAVGQIVPSVKDRKITINLDNQPLAVVMQSLMEKYDVAIGFEESKLDRLHNDYDFEVNMPAVATRTITDADGNVRLKISGGRVYKPKEHLFSINITDGKLEEVLNVIVKQMENYKWELSDGVFNIVPIRGRDTRFESLLNMKISKFSFKKGDNVEAISDLLVTLPELKTFLKVNDLYFNPSREGFDFQLDAQLNRKINGAMDFSEITFRDLLNKVTAIKRGGWILKASDRYGTKEREYIDINI